jgi:hypothetical protein
MRNYLRHKLKHSNIVDALYALIEHMFATFARVKSGKKSITLKSDDILSRIDALFDCSLD